LRRGKRKLKDLSIPDVLVSKRIYRGYPTEKPVELIETLILQSSDQNDIVADPFFGSGSSLKASHKQGRRSIGCDLSNTAHEHLKQSIAEQLPEGIAVTDVVSDFINITNFDTDQLITT